MEQKSVLDQIQELLAAGYGNVKEAIQEPGKFHARALGNLRQQIEENPEEVGMNWTGGGLGGMTKKAYRTLNAGDKIGKLTVGHDIPNMESISASGMSHTLPGIRSVPMSSFEVTAPHDLFYAKNDIDRIRALAEQIKQSGRIDPLIVGIDEKGNYILEGAHRLGALHLLGQKEFPAIMAIEPGITPNFK